MSFTIPITLGAAAFAAAAFGGVKTVEGVNKMNEAKEIGEYATERYQSAVNWLKADWEATNALAQEYAELQIGVKRHTIGGFVTSIDRLTQQVSQSDMKFLAELKGISVQQLQEYKAVAAEAEQFFKGGALLASMEFDSGLVTGSFMLAGESEKALTKARKYEAKVNAAIAKIAAVGDLVLRIQRRIDDLGDLMCALDDRAITLLNALESRPFDRHRDASKLQQLALLVKLLVEIMKTPVLETQGNLNPTAATIKTKYRNFEWN